MVEHEYDRTASDHCVFVKKFSDEEFIILLLYMDDMLIVGRDTSKINKMKNELSKSFEIKDLESANRTNGKLWLSQESYIEKVLDKFNMGKAKPMSSPLGSHLKLSSKQSPLMKWILRYLKGTSKTCLCFGTDIPVLVGCIDAYMVGDVDSESLLLAEHIAITKASKELLSKHIDVRYHWIRDALKMKLFCFEKIHTDENGSNMMTKSIPIEKLQFCRKQAGLVEPLT
ncbi:hypothetical protein AAG906_018967 [Vitis piasezkii]